MTCFAATSLRYPGPPRSGLALCQASAQCKRLRRMKDQVRPVRPAADVGADHRAGQLTGGSPRQSRSAASRTPARPELPGSCACTPTPPAKDPGAPIRHYGMRFARGAERSLCRSWGGSRN